MNLGKSIRGRYLAMGRRKGMVAPSGLITRYMPGRYGRRFLALRPLSLAHLKQAGKKGEGQGVVHLHSHLHLPWQVNLARHFTGIDRLAVIPAKGGTQEFLSLQKMMASQKIAHEPRRRRDAEKSALISKSFSQRLSVSAVDFKFLRFHGKPDFRQKHSGMTFEKIARASVPGRLSTSPSLLAGEGRGEGEIRRELHSYLTRVSIFTHPRPPFHREPAPGAIRGRRDDMRIIGGGQAVRTDIRILSPRPVTDADASAYSNVSVTSRNVARQAATENAPPLIRTKTSHESVRMVVKQEASNTASAAAPGQSASTSVASQTTTTGPAATAAAAVQAIQPKIDVNRLTDEVYRMLERRLITERERRGR